MRLKFLAAFIPLIALPPVFTAAAEPPPAFTLTDGADHPLAGKIWAVAQQRFLTPDELTALAAAGDSVLLGETHDNRDHHALQAWVLQRLIDHGMRPTVAFEMIDSSQEAALNKHLAASPADAAGLGAAIGWAKTGWPDWDWYAPIAQTALSAGLPIIPANLSRDQTKEAGRGDLPAPVAPYLNLSQALAPETRLAFEDDIRTSHCGMLPEAALPAMIRIQRARDAAMAAALDQAPQSVLIAGSGHVRADRAVPHILADKAPSRRVFALAFAEVQSDWAEPKAYGEYYGADKLPFDAVWFTAKAMREDQCEAFRKHMEKKKKG